MSPQSLISSGTSTEMEVTNFHFSGLSFPLKKICFLPSFYKLGLLHMYNLSLKKLYITYIHNANNMLCYTYIVYAYVFHLFITTWTYMCIFMYFNTYLSHPQEHKLSEVFCIGIYTQFITNWNYMCIHIHLYILIFIIYLTHKNINSLRCFNSDPHHLGHIRHSINIYRMKE